MPFDLSPRSSGLSVLTAAMGVVIVLVIGGAIVLRPSESDRATVGAGSAGTCRVEGRSDSETEPLGPTLVCLDGSGHVVLRLPRDASSVDVTADGATITFFTADTSVGFCGRCGSGPPYQAIVTIGETVGDFVVGGDANDLKDSPYPMPAWSPDGGSIAYQDAAGDLRVQVLGVPQVAAGRAGLINATYRRLTDDPASDEFPAWSPDGSVIVYSNLGAVPADADGYSPTQEIWSVNARGGDPVRLTANGVSDTQPDISTDGTVAFMRDFEIWTMALNGGDQRLLEATAGGGYFAPRWSPDGTMLALLRYDPSDGTTAHPDMGIREDLPLLEVVVLDLATNEVIPLGARVVTDLNPPSWMADGTALLVNVYDIVTPGG